MNLNLFRVLTPAEQEAQREYTDLQTWSATCRALGALPAQLAAYENAAQAFAATTLYPNSRIVAVARQAAKESLMRGDGMPPDPEAAVLSLWSNELRRTLGL